MYVNPKKWIRVHMRLSLEDKAFSLIPLEGWWNGPEENEVMEVESRVTGLGEFSLIWRYCWQFLIITEDAQMFGFFPLGKSIAPSWQIMGWTTFWSIILSKKSSKNVPSLTHCLSKSIHNFYRRKTSFELGSSVMEKTAQLGKNLPNLGPMLWSQFFCDFCQISAKKWRFS
jgi:hypothetical protein